MTTVAVLGAGTMGAGMARSLLRAGLRVRVWNRTPAAAGALAGAGAEPVGSVAEAVRGADVVLTMLFDADAVTQVGPDICAGAGADTVWLQCATIGPEAMRALAGQVTGPVRLVDAPVLGTKQPAENGTLVVLTSGPAQAVHAAGPVLEAISSRVVDVGEQVGAASALKLACNAWLVTMTAGIAQSLALTQALGLDPQLFLDAVGGGTQDSPYLQRKGAQMIAGQYPTGFSLAAAAKDVDLTHRTSQAAGVPTDLLEALVRIYDRAQAAGPGSDDVAAVRRGF